MAKTTITFKALTYDGKIVRKNVTIEHNYQVIPSCIWNGIELPPTSIEEQVMNELDETDKSQIMQDYEFEMILDYWPKKPSKKKASELNGFMEYCEPLIEAMPSFKRPFEAIISDAKDTLFGKRKSNKTKLMEVMKMYELIMKGSEGTLNMLNNMLKQMTNEDKKSLK